MIKNPILPGFHPDPSILRVGDDYYIANSTFEWWPGVQIHHSRDLKHWQLITHPLTRVSQLELRGNVNSSGVWAPQLSYDQDAGLFYLCYTNVKTFGPLIDFHNYMITASDIMGPWSEPVYLNSCGFDPSLFHDDDGRKWVITLQFECRKGYEHPGPYVLQEFSVEQQKLVGPVKEFYRGGTDFGCLEGAHLYKYQGRYYIMSAEGGTGYGHSVTLSRSDKIDGPYEWHPNNPVISAAKEFRNDRGNPIPWKPDLYNPDAPLQKTGHASIVETQHGEWYLVHLCARPLMPQLRCTLGRETAIQKVTWNEEGWLVTDHGDCRPLLEVPEPKGLTSHPFENLPVKDDFDSPELNIHLNSLRIPPDDSWLSLTERPGFLRLRGRESLFSLHNQSLIARRVQSFKCMAETSVEFHLTRIRQWAGLVCFYNTRGFYYLSLSYNDREKCNMLSILLNDNGQRDELLDDIVLIGNQNSCHMRAEIDYDKLQFSYSLDGNNWQPIGPVLDASKLSDEYIGGGQFTGLYVGMCTQDLDQHESFADFDYFMYKGID